MELISSDNGRDSVSSDSDSCSANSSDVEMIPSLSAAISQNQTTYANDLEYIAQAVALSSDDVDNQEYIHNENSIFQVSALPQPQPLPVVKPSTEYSSSDDDSESSENDRENRKSVATSSQMEILDELCAEEEETVPLDGSVRTKNEINPPVSVILPDTKIEPGDEIVAIGCIHSYIESDNALVIKSYVTNNPLAEKSMLCVRNGDGVSNEISMIGTVSEIFGPLSTPFYVVRWCSESRDEVMNSEPSASKSNRKIKKNSVGLPSDIGNIDVNIAESVVQHVDLISNAVVTGDEKKAPVVLTRPQRYNLGTVVYSIKRLMTVIVPDLIKKATGKGSDASNLFDEEVGSVILFF